MAERILIIDDDHHLLSALRRQLSDSFDITTAQGGREALSAIRQAETAQQQPFAVAVCDMRMPEMDGIETLRQIKDISPDTVRIMLTGNADQQTAMDAINQGAIFRFFTKPCPAERLTDGLNAALAQYRLITAERELLEKTLSGSIKVLVDVVSMNDPAAYAMASRLREWVRLLTVEFKLPQRWQLNVAAMLIPIGQVAIPPELLARHKAGQSLTEAEKSVFERAPEAARNLIANIPRLNKVAEVVLLQDRGFDGSGFPADGPKGNDIPFDARLLKILKDLAEATGGGPPTRAAFARLDQRPEQYDPILLSKVRACLEVGGEAPPSVEAEVPVAALRVGHTLLADLRLTNGHLILPANTQLSAPQIERLRSLRKGFQFKEPVPVRQ